MKIRRIVIEVEVPFAAAKAPEVELLQCVKDYMASKLYPHQAQTYWDISANTQIGDVMKWPPKKVRASASGEEVL